MQEELILRGFDIIQTYEQYQQKHKTFGYLEFSMKNAGTAFQRVLHSLYGLFMA